MHHVVSAERAEHQAEHGRADQDQKNHADNLRGFLANRPHQAAKRRLAGREHYRADSADRRGFGRRCNAAKDGTEHGGNQGKRRNQHFGKTAQHREAAQGIRIGRQRG